MEECCLVDVDEKDGVLDLDQMWRDEYFKVVFRTIPNGYMYTLSLA